MGLTDSLRRLDARLSRYAMNDLKGVGYPNPGWAPPAGWVGPSASGVVVNDENARTVSAWYAGVRVIAEDVAGLPLILYRRSGPDGRMRERATDHPLYRLLHDAPNPEMTSMVFRETLQAHLLTWGNAYAEKELNGAGQVVGLWPLRPDRMEVYWDKAGRRAYRYRVTAYGAPVEMEPRRVFHIPGLGFDGLVGYSLLRMARETLGQSIALRDYANRVLQNDARPSVTLEHPGVLSATARQNIKDAWVAEFGGFTNAGRMAVLEEGMKLNAMEMPQEDLLFLASQQWQVTEIARWLRVAPHKIGDLSRATFSNIEEQGLDHVVSTLRAWLVRWEQQLNKDVVRDPSLYAEHLVDALLRGDSVTRATAANIQFRAGVLLGDEWRALENRNPLPDGLGSSPMVSADMQSMPDLNAARELEQNIEQVKAGLLTLDEGRQMLGRDPIEWNEGPTPEEMASLIEQVKAGLLTHDEVRAMLNREPIEWPDELSPDEVATVIELVKAGLMTENEARALMKRGPMEWAEGPSPDEMASLLEQLKAGVLSHDEVREAIGRPPVKWDDELSTDEIASLLEQVKAGVLTENEAREIMKRPPMEWAEGPSLDDINTLVAQIKEGLLTIDEARASLGRPPVQWPEDLSEKVEQASGLIKAGFDPADVLRTLGLPPIRHLGLPPVTVQKAADAETPATPPDALPMEAMS